MSDSVPCRLPYAPRLPRDGSNTITLHVGRGTETERITASVELLCRGSDYFYDRLSTRDADMSHLPLSFPSELPAIFHVVLTFLRTGELRYPNLRRTSRADVALGFIVELFAFSADFGATTFRNALLDAFFLRLATSSRRLRLRDVSVRQVYESTSANSSPRDLLATVVVNTENIREVEKREDDLPKMFLLDCLKIASEDEIVPFGKRSREAREWMEGKAGRICEAYHVHDEGEDEMMDEDMPDENHDKGGHDDGGDDDMDGDDSRGQDELENMEKTKQELAFIEEMRELRIRY